MEVTLRPAQSNDEPLLYALYASTRADEMRLVDWAPEQKEAFVRMQFEAQRQHYQRVFPDAEHSVVLVDGTAAGRILVARPEVEIRVVDIVILPAYRNQGIGSGLLRELLEEGRRAGKPVRLHALRFEQARRLYERLGFVTVEDQGLYDFMEWRPVTAARSQ